MVQMQLATERHTHTETMNKNEGGDIKTSRCPLVYLPVFLSIIKTDRNELLEDVDMFSVKMDRCIMKLHSFLAMNFILQKNYVKQIIKCKNV